MRERRNPKLSPAFRLLSSVIVAMVLLASCSGSTGDATGDDSATSTPAGSTGTETSEVAPTTAPTTTDETSTEQATVEPTTPPTAAAPGPSSDALQTILDDAVADLDGGIAVLLTQGTNTITAAAGSADASGAPLQTNALFRAGSISKTFISTMVLQLAEEGSVDLDEPLSTYLPDTPVGGDVVVRQLLNHTSGVASYTENPNMFAEVVADGSRWYEPADVLDWAVEMDPTTADTFRYSNTNYILLGQLVVALDQNDLDTSLQTRIAQPLGLSSTFFPTEETVNVTGLASGWSAGFATGDDTDYRAMVSSAWSAGALTSSTADLATFLEALLDGQLINNESLDAMTTMGNQGYGLGLMAVGLGPDAPGFGHGGLIPGYSSLMGSSPEGNVTLVVLANNDAVNVQQLATSIILDLPTS